MEELHLFVAETAAVEGADPSFVLKDEITQEELELLNSAFRVCSYYHSITQIKDIVIENGESFKLFMTPENLKKVRSQQCTPERVIMLANKAVLNYASSIKTYIDMETRLIKKNAKTDELTRFESICHAFYDQHVEYRFWANFRNYTVHCEFPYSIYQESIEDGCKIICTKEHLLQFNNWKHSRADIQKMSDQIDLPKLVDNMSALIYALYIDFFSHFALEIVDGIKSYGAFCRKYDVKVPVVFKLKDKKHIEGCHCQPFPIKELKASFDILNNNPNITINIE